MSKHGVHAPEVKYMEAEPTIVTITGYYYDGNSRATAEYIFRMEGGTAVLKTIAQDGIYHISAAKDGQAAVKQAVADLPFVQAVIMFPEVDA
jgi:predicted adenine nucleotide alpha hydrolase (AANH) superfamily ATPase